jgi:predicted XRE-type DNA-binding protein
MTKKNKYKSDILAVLHETAAGLHRIGLIPEKTMREFDASCLVENEIEIIRGSGNIYRDCGDKKYNVKQSKAIIAAEIIAVLDKKKLPATKAEVVYGISQADITRIRNTKLDRLSIAKLTSILKKLSSRDEIRSDYSGVDLGKPVIGKHYKAAMKGIKIVLKPDTKRPGKGSK